MLTYYFEVREVVKTSVGQKFTALAHPPSFAAFFQTYPKAEVEGVKINDDSFYFLDFDKNRLDTFFSESGDKNIVLSSRVTEAYEDRFDLLVLATIKAGVEAMPQLSFDEKLCEPSKTIKK